MEPRAKETIPDLDESGDSTRLKENTGTLRRIVAGSEVSRANADAWTRVEKVRADARANIAVTALTVAQAQIRAAVVGGAMPQLGALAVHLNGAIAVVDESLTSSGAAEASAHMSNRAATVAFADQLLHACKITAEEHATILRFADSDASDDIARSRERMKRAKGALDGLHETALEGIQRSKNLIR